MSGSDSTAGLAASSQTVQGHPAASRLGNGALASKALKDYGTIEAGKSADILLLGADPLADIRNIRKLDLVMKGLAPESLIMATNIERLSVLPLGAPDRQATELLASERMGRICQALSRNAARRIAIFDSSPLLLTTEAAALSSQVGQVVMVVRANSTPQRAVLDAVGRLDPEKAIGIVLNGASEAAGKSGYGTYDSYGAS